MNKIIKTVIIDIAVFVIVLSAIWIFFALRTDKAIKEFEELKSCCTEATTGKITDVKESWRYTGTKVRRKQYYYYNYYTYTVEDKNYEGYAKTYKDTRNTLGDPIEVHYDPYEPMINYTVMDKPSDDHYDVVESIVMSVVGIIVGIFIICCASGWLKIFVRKDEMQLLDEYEEVISENNTDDSDV